MTRPNGHTAKWELVQSIDLLTGTRFPVIALTHVDGTLSPWPGAGLGAGDREDLPQAPKDLRSRVRGQGQCWHMATGTKGQGHGVPREAQRSRHGVGKVRKHVPKEAAFELALKPEEIER